jgi:hypothetical protein
MVDQHAASSFVLKGVTYMRNIEGKKWYRPREIAELGLIKNSTGGNNIESNYNFILVQIRNGNLRAKNYSEGHKLAYYLVSEDAITEYHKSEG